MSISALLPLAACLVGALTCSCAATPGPDSRSAADTPTSDVDQTDDGVTYNPYHAIVRSKILNAFRGLTNHDARAALDVMADDVTYTFEGDHSLGGTRV